MELAVVIAFGGNKRGHSMTRGWSVRPLLRASYRGKHGNPIKPHRPGLYATTRHAIDLFSSFWFWILRLFLLRLFCFLPYYDPSHHATRFSIISSLDKRSPFSFSICIYADLWQKCQRLSIPAPRSRRIWQMATRPFSRSRNGAKTRRYCVTVRSTQSARRKTHIGPTLPHSRISFAQK